VPESLTTQVLIQQFQQGDRASLDQLCTRYLRRVLAAVRLRLGVNLRRKLDSADIVQNVMIRALRGVKSFEFRTEGAFLKYLNRVVEHEIRDEADHWAAQKRDMNREVSLDEKRSPGSASPLDTLGERASPTPSKIISLQEDLDRLEYALDRLGQEAEEYRDLIVAVRIEGQTYEEIAEQRDTSSDAVRMKVKRAVLALTRIYRDLERDR